MNEMETDNVRPDNVRPTFLRETLDYDLAEALIAEKPTQRRQDARLLLIDRRSPSPVDRIIADLPDLLHPGDLLVLNNTKVLPAKFDAVRGTGGKVGGLFVDELKPKHWRVMLQGSSRLREGETIALRAGKGSLNATLLQREGEGLWEIQVHSSEPPHAILDRFGQTPLPPYIRRKRRSVPAAPDDASRYQTVYATHDGAIAAPTAGLHLTKDLLESMEDRGIEIAFVTLHVGIGTFRPIKTDDLADHDMHGERFDLPAETAARIIACRQRGGRIVAVGTTTVRVLESVAALWGGWEHIQPTSGTTHAFIYPPYSFSCVDALLTNFHLPGSTLLALVMAFAGVARTRSAYRHAIEARYRFYSYGDAMLIV
ncbi:MAG: tRNA preQ1(34) S-adenosylmethionine ribosyltransferase-isomerase QueA [Phycisphaerae bacterium]